MSSSRFDFRISFVSMLALFLFSACLTVGLKYASFYGWIPFRALAEVTGLKFATMLWVWVRGAVILLVVVCPFRSHIDMRPVLFWVTWGVSFVGTAAPWLWIAFSDSPWFLVPGPLSAASTLEAVWKLSLMTVGLSHLAAVFLTAALFTWDDNPLKKVVLRRHGTGLG